MGTRSNVYVETDPGTYLGTYCHYDGYPSHMFPTLRDISNDKLLSHVLVAMTRGGFRILHSDEGTEYLDGEHTCIMTDPHMEDWGPDFIWIKCHDGSVKWRDSAESKWNFTEVG